MRLVYNVPVEVTRKQYGVLLSRCGGRIATRYDYASGKFYMKMWRDRRYVESVLASIS